jgi:hypothetical protein
MTVHAQHEGIQYEINEIRPGEWLWSFTPPSGARRSGRVQGNSQWARVVAQRAIEVWRLMNKGASSEAA